MIDSQITASEEIGSNRNLVLLKGEYSDQRHLLRCSRHAGVQQVHSQHVSLTVQHRDDHARSL